MSLMLDERPVQVGGDAAGSPAVPEVIVRVRGERGRRRPTLTGIVALALVGVLVVGALAVARGWVGLGNLFASRTIDRSAPVLVQKVRNLSDYRAASGTFSTTVDLEHKVGILPTFIAGGRVVYSGVGQVDATVDLGQLTTASTSRNADGGLVLRLPHARLGTVVLDAARSHLMNRDRGVLDRIGGVFVDAPTSERAVEQVSRRRIATAAQRGNLRARAEHNTASMIRKLARTLGVGPVEVRFGSDPASSATVKQA